MAGKLHKDFVRYRDGGGQVLDPKHRRARAYAEGYQARRKNQLQATNPHPAWQNTDQQSTWWAWDQGWRDGDALLPATHVGGPDITTPLPGLVALEDVPGIGPVTAKKLMDAGIDSADQLAGLDYAAQERVAEDTGLTLSQVTELVGAANATVADDAAVEWDDETSAG